MLRLWCRLAAAAPTGLLAWELPYAMTPALKRKKKKKIQRSEKIQRKRKTVKQDRIIIVEPFNKVKGL